MTEPDLTFDALVADLDSPMVVVTAAAGASWPLSGRVRDACSIDPPRFLVCVSKRTRTYRVARGAELLAVHFLPADATDLAELLEETGDRVDKFARSEWRPGPGGVPLLERYRDRFVGRCGPRRRRDHVAFVLAPVIAEKGHGGGQFRFGRAKRLEAGHEA